MIGNIKLGSRVFLTSFSVAMLSVAGCTEPGETTGVAAATGGVLGAGLGAIVGNQTGDPGSGLVIGAAAGAGSGALIGNALEAQDKSIRAQDEAIERQEQTIAAQRAELEELRRINQDRPDVRGGLRRELGAAPVPRAVPPTPPRTTSAPSYSQRLYGSRAADTPAKAAPMAGGVQERTIASTELPSSAPMVAPAAPPQYGSVKSASSSLSAECSQAGTEASKAQSAMEAADKLFHYRRAIRLCPTNPDFHASLGEIYLSLNRKEDAQFEFREALNINPQHEAARRGMQNSGTVIGDNRF